MNGNKRNMKNFYSEGKSKMQININSVQSLQSFIRKSALICIMAYKITIESKPYEVAFHEFTIKICIIYAGSKNILASM